MYLSTSTYHASTSTVLDPNPASYPLIPSWNKLHILMHNIVLHMSIYLFPWLHVLCDLSPINNARKHAISTIFISVVFFEH